MIIRSKAPLRLGLAGGGTDVSPYCDEFGGYVLNATLDMYAYCTIETTNVHTVSFFAADRDEYFESKACEQLVLDGHLDLHKGIYNRIVREFNHFTPLSLKITTYSDAPAGSGLGSSSTMVVAIIQAYVEWLNLPLGEYDIAHLAYEIERVDVGLNGGRQDQYAATFGGFNFIEFYSEDRVIVNPLRIKSWVVNELENSIVLYYTGASRESANIINEQVKNAENKNEKSLQAMHELKADALIMKEAILKGELQKFAEFLGKSWEAKKRMASSISNHDIDHIYDIAMEAGAYAGKVSGAGGGGFMIFMVDPVRRLQLIKELKRLPGEVINFHFTSVGAEGWKA
ncbi:GHMP family kinase ATP-binding protein [Paenibacillus eucommiae]|uniref:D-glycero-alpha-D-manno-heptose-7-phosphate kinase n=1 Tax=Paenibacillus eucommiae TaxID=1355755 RepID=A0ABS4IU81_9BACL|nr:GHMP kinase [Paenibacillus eucommiae]MBP1991146.1 D-glycero-alpha-D-manno-heptose-7-phosphate kinase [Paenibacillus eucommiae]